MIPLPKISEPAVRALKRIGINDLESALRLTDERLLSLHGFGQKGVDILRSYHIQYHKDGSVWAYGQVRDGKTNGHWQWFRKDGTRLRSGYFENGKQVSEWVTFDTSGNVYKITNIKE